tara:strand:+ start:1265 stop:1780 length:516 start_codon:yes stop_codon:yes gene_type:complete
VKKLIVALIIGMFALVGVEKNFGFKKAAQAKVVLGGLEMKSDDFALMKGFIYEAIQAPSFDEKLKAKCAEVLVWLAQKLVDKKTHDLTKTTDDLSRLYRAIVGDIGTFFNSGAVPMALKKQKSSQWVALGKKVVVKFVRIAVKSKSSGKTTTKVEWDISIPKSKKTKGKKK